MPTPDELEHKFWKALRSDMTVMVGLKDFSDDHPRPLTAQLEGDADAGPIWFFTARDTTLVKALHGSPAAIGTFTSKGHDLFATIHGTLTLDNDPARIDALWNPFVAAWYEGGRTDPKLALLRFDPDRGEVWENAHSFIAGLKMLVGIDPKADYRDKVAEVSLR